jgi:YHS domain-containing protein
MLKSLPNAKIMRKAAMRHLRISLIIAGIASAVFGFGGSAQADNQRLALKGYDPVAYFTEKQPMKGDPQHQHQWDGATYRFASAKHLEIFKADPDRYLPQYNNLCAASLANGVKIEGNPEYWLVADGRLYLFGGPRGPALMSQNVSAMKGKADANLTLVPRRPSDSKL